MFTNIIILFNYFIDPTDIPLIIHEHDAKYTTYYNQYSLLFYLPPPMWIQWPIVRALYTPDGKAQNSLTALRLLQHCLSANES